MKAGFVQYHPEFGNVQANLDRVEKLLEGKRADLFVLPELFSTVNLIYIMGIINGVNVKMFLKNVGK